jgi:phage minor structural protein
MLIDRVEIYDDLKCVAGAEYKASIPPYEIIAATVNEDLTGKDELALTFDRACAAWDEIAERRVLRLIGEDDSVREYRITGPGQQRGQRGDKLATVRAVSPFLDLGNGIVSRTEADGTVTLVYTLLSQTRSDLVDLILAGVPSHFAKGTVDGSTTKVTAFSFDFDTPLSALQELAALEGLELAVRRNGDTNYLVDLVEQVGSSATVAQFRYRKNIQGVKRETDAADLANRIYPAGGGDGVVRLTLGKARWEVTGIVSSTVFEVGGTPIYVDDHLVGNYIEKADESLIEITDTDYTNQRVTTTSAHGLNTGDYVWFRLNGSGTELAYVEDPDSQATYGIVRAVIDEADLPPVDNLASNPTLSDWMAGDPDDWTDVGTPTVTENTDAQYTQTGGASAKVVADAEGEGLVSDAITVSPVDPLKFFSGFVSLYVESGQVEFYWQHSTEGRFPPEGAEEAAFTSETGRFIELSIQGKEFPSGTVQLYVIARGGAATFYLDAAQFTNTAANYAFFDGSGACELWRRGLTALDERSLPKVKYTIEGLDLTTIDPTTFPYDALTLGGDVYVKDDDLDLEVTTRVLFISRDVLGARTLRLELSNRSEDLIDELTIQKRRYRYGFEDRPHIPGIFEFIASIKVDGTVALYLTGSGTTRSFRYLVDTSSMPSFSTVVSTGTASNEVEGAEVETSTSLSLGQTAYVRVVVFASLNGLGTAGTTKSVQVTREYTSLAEILSSSITESGTSPNMQLRRTFGPNKETVAISIYRRKTDSTDDYWPTRNNLQTGQLDWDYYKGEIDQHADWAYVDSGWATNDRCNEIAVPLDANWAAGSREEYTYDITGTPSPRITTTGFTELAAGTACSPSTSRRKLQVSWETADVTDPSHDMRIYVRVNGGSWSLAYTETSPVKNTDYDYYAPMYQADPPTGYLQSVDFRLDLWDGSEVDDSRIVTETEVFFGVGCS